MSLSLLLPRPNLYLSYLLFLLLLFLCLFFFFFFQAEDGIRDLYVTGVQTCALPIWFAAAAAANRISLKAVSIARRNVCWHTLATRWPDSPIRAWLREPVSRYHRPFRV